MAEFYDTDEAIEGFSRSMRTSTSFMTLIAAFVWSNMHATTEDNKYSITVRATGSVDNTTTLNEDNKWPRSRFNSTSEENLGKKSSKRYRTRYHRKRRGKDVN